MPDLEHLKHAVVDIPVEEVILRRWSPRAFSDRPVSPADLKSVFTAAEWAASSYNEQPWRFLVGTRGDEAYTKILNALVPMNQSWAKSAPVLFASFAKKTFTKGGKSNHFGAHDTGAACANLALQATALGMHLHGMAGFDEDALRASFGVPSDFDPVACWALGYAGDPANLPDPLKVMEQSPRERKPLREVVFQAWDEPASL